jgi:formamidopyrimidine-DNA glycosylase
MPELPEVENVKRSLEKKLIDRTITNVSVEKASILHKNTSEYFISNCENQVIRNIQRKGKYLWFELNDDRFIVGHLGMTGAFFYVRSLDEIPEKYRKHTHVKFHIDHKIMAYCDIRRFGSLQVLSSGELAAHSSNNLGPEPFGERSKTRFIANLNLPKYKNKDLKSLLLDQAVIAGVGNIYACETLHQSGIHPLKTPSELNEDGLSLLFDTTSSILQKSIDLGGSSISDYMDADGNKGSYQNHFTVYQQKKPYKPCPFCKGAIENLKIKGRATFFCPTCQKN